MRALIITGGSIDAPFADSYIKEREWDYLVCADRGLEFCRETDRIPDLILGDFDSADGDALSFYKKRIPERIERFPSEKDETDTELAISYAIRAGASEITILGATGTRLDHVLGNIQLLQMSMQQGVPCYLVDAHNRIRMVREPLSLKKEEQFGNYVSLIPFTPSVKGLSLKGFAYEVDDYELVSGIARGVSNEITEETAEISFAEGILLVIESRD